MEKKKKEKKDKKTVLQTIAEQKKALAKCVRENGDITKVAQENEIKLANPL